MDLLLLVHENFLGMKDFKYIFLRSMIFDHVSSPQMTVRMKINVFFTTFTSLPLYFPFQSEWGEKERKRVSTSSAYIPFSNKERTPAYTHITFTKNFYCSKRYDRHQDMLCITVYRVFWSNYDDSLRWQVYIYNVRICDKWCNCIARATSSCIVLKTTQLHTELKTEILINNNHLVVVGYF